MEYKLVLRFDYKQNHGILLYSGCKGESEVVVRRLRTCIMRRESRDVIETRMDGKIPKRVERKWLPMIRKERAK